MSEADRAQQSAHYELKLRLEAAEEVSTERVAQLAAKQTELESKLHTSEEGFKALRVESSKTEWTMSELRSRLQMEESRLQAKQSEAWEY